MNGQARDGSAPELVTKASEMTGQSLVGPKAELMKAPTRTVVATGCPQKRVRWL